MLNDDQQLKISRLQIHSSEASTHDKSLQTGALLLDGNTLNYFGSSIPINLILAVVAEVVLVGGAEYYRITNGLVSNKST